MNTLKVIEAKINRQYFHMMLMGIKTHELRQLDNTRQLLADAFLFKDSETNQILGLIPIINHTLIHRTIEDIEKWGAVTQTQAKDLLATALNDPTKPVYAFELGNPLIIHARNYIQ